jgi:hypothetical protein
MWRNDKGLHLRFGREEYDKLISSARGDFSWEDAKRSAERLVSVAFSGASVDDGCTFDWASARVREGFITLSFSGGASQRLLEFSWDGRTPEDALVNAKRFHRERFEHDPATEKLPMGTDTGEGPSAGGADRAS